MISGAAALAELVRTAGETAEPGVHRTLPVAPELSGLLPGHGLRRGSTVAVATGRAAPAGGSTSLLLALLSEASRSGSWCAIVGVPALGALAAAESGIALDRLALVPNPGPEWATVVAALIDGVDVVVAAVPGNVAPTIAGRLVARARQRGCVLVPFGHWDGADVTLQVTEGRWEGLGAGRGRLRRREVTVLARGRGAAARPKKLTMWMPGVTVRPPTIPPPPTTGPASPVVRSTPPAASPAPGAAPPATALTSTSSPTADALEPRISLPGRRGAASAVGVFPDRRRAESAAGVLPGWRVADPVGGVLPGRRRAGVAVGAQPGQRRTDLLLPGRRRAGAAVKVRVRWGRTEPGLGPRMARRPRRSRAAADVAGRVAV